MLRVVTNHSEVFKIRRADMPINRFFEGQRFSRTLSGPTRRRSLRTLQWLCGSEVDGRRRTELLGDAVDWSGKNHLLLNVCQDSLFYAVIRNAGAVIGCKVDTVEAVVDRRTEQAASGSGSGSF